MPYKRRRRRKGGRRSSHEIDTPSITISQEKANTPSGFNPLGDKVIASTGKTTLGTSTAQDKFDLSPYFKSGLVKGKTGIMSTNRTNVKLNVPIGTGSGDKPFNLVSNVTVAPGSVVRSKPEYKSFKGFGGQLKGLVPGTGQFDKKTTGLNVDIGVKKNISTPGSRLWGRVDKDAALRTNINLEAGLNVSNLRKNIVKPYAKLQIQGGGNTDQIRKIKNTKFGQKFSLGATAGLGFAGTFFNKSKGSSITRPEHLDASPNTFRGLSAGIDLKHKKSGITLSYTQSRNRNLSNNAAISKGVGIKPQHGISLKIPLKGK